MLHGGAANSETRKTSRHSVLIFVVVSANLCGWSGTGLFKLRGAARARRSRRRRQPPCIGSEQAPSSESRGRGRRRSRAVSIVWMGHLQLNLVVQPAASASRFLETNRCGVTALRIAKEVSPCMRIAARADRTLSASEALNSSDDGNENKLQRC